MKKGLLITLVILAVVVVIVVIMLNRDTSDTNTNTNQTVNTSSGSVSSATPAPGSDGNVNELSVSQGAMDESDDETVKAGTTEVGVSASTGFVPRTVTISVGDTVRWMNEGASTVYVAPDDHPTHVAYSGIWDDDGTGQIGPGETYSFTFTTAGTYSYHDHLNPNNTGTVIVQ